MIVQPRPQDVTSAAERIADMVRETPTLSLATGEAGANPVLLKLEHLQHTGSFKPRGASNTLLQADVPEAGVIAASGGNHGIAVAYAASKLGHRVEIFVPTISSPTKVAKLKSLGAIVNQIGATYAEALEALHLRQAETGALGVHAYDQASVVEGQGTMMRELEQQDADWTTALVAVGGGGFVAGAMAWLCGRKRVIAVEPETSCALHAAMQKGEPVDVNVSGVATDSLGARRVGELPFSLANRDQVETVLVSDAAICEAQDWLWQKCQIIAEPGGATALAALRSGKISINPEERVAVVVCGGNANVRLTDR